MNIIDIIILVVLGLSVAYGLYKGFVHSLLSLACGLIAFFLAFTFSPKLVEFVSNDPGISAALVNYTDAGARVGDLNLSSQQVTMLDENSLSRVLENVNLPEPIENVLKNNLLSDTFSENGLTTVNDYVSYTVVGIAIHILCFILCYIAAHLVLSILVNIIHHVFRLPLLKHLDWLAGGVLGLFRGALILYVIFLALPLINTIVSIDALNELTAASTLAPIFQSNGLFARVIGNL